MKKKLKSRKTTRHLQKDKKHLLILIPLTLTIFLCCILLILTFKLITFWNTPNLSSPQPQQEKFIISQLPKTGEESEEEELNTYTNQAFGYIFNYPSSIKVRELKFNTIFDSLTDTKGENITILNLLYISAYHSDVTLDIDFDEGLERALFKEPQQTVIDDETFYYIISNEGYVQMLTPEYKYIDDVLWIKTEHKVAGNRGEYYISFDGKSIPNAIPEEKIDKFETIFKTFTF